MRHTGCLDSPPTTVHLGVEREGPSGTWSGVVIEIDSQQVPSMSSGSEVVLSFSNVIELIKENPQLQFMRRARLHVWVDPVLLEFQVEGQTVTVEESSKSNNKGLLTLGEMLLILGPNMYFLPRGQTTFTIMNPTEIWSAVSGAELEG